MGDPFLENYDSCADTIRKLYDSRLRLSILDALKDGPYELYDEDMAAELLNYAKEIRAYFAKKDGLK